MALSSTTSDFAATLAQAAAAFQGKSTDRPLANTVVAALLQAEKAAKRQRSSYALESLLGDWRLCFATGTRKVRQRGGIILGKGFYVPKLAAAQIAFAPSDSQESAIGEIANQLQVGALRLRFTGPFRYLGKKNLLAFDFTQVQLDCFGRSIYRGQVGRSHNAPFAEQSIAKQPFFAFFWVTDDLIAARGRGGGLAIWVKQR